MWTMDRDDILGTTSPLEIALHSNVRPWKLPNVRPVNPYLLRISDEAFGACWKTASHDRYAARGRGRLLAKEALEAGLLEGTRPRRGTTGKGVGIGSCKGAYCVQTRSTYIASTWRWLVRPVPCSGWADARTYYSSTGTGHYPPTYSRIRQPCAHTANRPALVRRGPLSERWPGNWV